ncbi:adhesion G protein-coupled receptor L2-like [Ptychodera flava]|uniref:adhesion G protein-coupled receptor L2-like n=1 Tax=Ptychodera flava TaxID=63121 RepID=UPI00396A29A7
MQWNLYYPAKLFTTNKFYRTRCRSKQLFIMIPPKIIPSDFVESESNSRSWVKTITAIKKVTKVNTAVMSVNIYINNNSQLTYVEEPVSIEFTPIKLGYDARCSYMKHGDQTGVWSTEGCLTEHDQGSGKITCKCSRLTTFAVIMTLGKKPIPFPEEARDIIMQIACYLNVTLMLLSFCMVCTAGLQVDGHFVLLNIISSLTLHPISIIWNLASDGDKSPCKTVKFLWYFALLSNFAWMMNYSIHQFLKLRKFIIRKMSYRIAYTIIGWVIPFAMAFVSYNVETIYGAGWSCIDNPNGVELIVLCTIVSCFSLVTVVLSVKLHKLYYVVYGDEDTVESKQIWHEILSLMLVSATVTITWIFCLIYVANGDLTMAYSCAGAVFVEGSVVYLSMCATNRELLQAARINICGSAEEKAARKELLGYINQCDEVKADTDVDSGDNKTLKTTDVKPVVIHGAFGETTTSKSSQLHSQQTTEDDIEVTQL